MSDDTARWVATLSDGSTVAEHAGEFQIVPGERKPWIRLCQFAADNNLHLTSLRLNFKGRTIHLPRSKFDRFDMNESSRTPAFYALQYHLEGTFEEDGSFSQTDFIDLAAHYDDFVVHYIQNITDANTSWVVVTNADSEPLAPSPRSD
jgi:hypothetical protein